MSRALFADFVLLFITLCWGITFPLIANAIDHVPSAAFVSLRCLVAAVVLFVFLRRDLFPCKKYMLWAAFWLGVFTVITYLPQTISLETLPSARAAFLTGTNVVMVPFLATVFGLGKIRNTDLICVIVCLFGLFIVTGAHFANFTTGDLWGLLSALGTALAIVYLQKATQHPQSIKLNALVFYQIVFTGFLAFPFSYHQSWRGFWNIDTIIGIVFCAVVASSLALFLQTRYQHRTTAVRAAMIFSLEPIFAGVAGYLINHEPITVHFIVGASFMIAAIVGNEWIRNYQQKPSGSH